MGTEHARNTQDVSLVVDARATRRRATSTSTREMTPIGRAKHYAPVVGVFVLTLVLAVLGGTRGKDALATLGSGRARVSTAPVTFDRGRDRVTPTEDNPHGYIYGEVKRTVTKMPIGYGALSKNLGPVQFVRRTTSRSSALKSRVSSWLGAEEDDGKEMKEFTLEADENATTTTPAAVSLALLFADSNCVQSCSSDAKVAKFISGDACSIVGTMECINKNCDCAEAFTIHEALIYSCDLDKTGAPAEFSEIVEFVSETSISAASTCADSKELDNAISSMNAFGSTETVSNTSSLAQLGAGCTPGSDAPWPANCATPDLVTPSCDYWSDCGNPFCNAFDYPVGGQACGSCCSGCVSYPCGGGCSCGCRRCGYRGWGTCCSCNCWVNWCQSCWSVTVYQTRCRSTRLYRASTCAVCAPGFVRRSDGQCELSGGIQDIINSIAAVTKSIEEAPGKVNQAKSTVQGYISTVETQITTISSKIDSLANDFVKKLDAFMDNIVKSIAFINADELLSAVNSVISYCSGDAANLGEAERHAAKMTQLLGLLDADNEHELESMYAKLFERPEPERKVPQEDTVAQLGACKIPISFKPASGNLPSACLIGQVCVQPVIPAFALNRLGNVVDKLNDYAEITIDVKDRPLKFCFGVSEFRIPYQVATGLAQVMIDVVKPIINAGLNEVKSWGTDITKGLTTAKNTIDDVTKTVKSTINGFSVGKRRLLEAKETDEEKLNRLLNQLGRLEALHDNFKSEMEAKLRLHVKTLRSNLVASPFFGSGKHSVGGHNTASLGKNAFASGDDIIRGLQNALSNMDKATLKLRFGIDLDLGVAITASNSLFRHGDLLKGEAETSFMQETPIGYGFAIESSGTARVKLPWMFMAEAKGTFQYTAKSTDSIYVEAGVKDGGGFIGVGKKPDFTITQTAGASFSAAFKTGIEVEVEDFQTRLCFAGLICSGPRVQASQPVYIGADAFASVSATSATQPACFGGSTTLTPLFADTFGGYYADSDSSCRLKSTGAVAAAGAYFEFPKTNVKVELVTEVNGDEECVPKKSLYSMNGGDWFAPTTIAKTCAATGSGTILTSCGSGDPCPNCA